MLVLLGVVLAVVLLELGMRSVGWAFERSRQQRMERQLAASNELRILCLGESMTEGDPWHLRYPEALQRILNAQPLGVQVTVINGGKGGTRSDEILGELEANLGRYRPHMVVTMMGINDRGKTHAYGSIIAPGEGHWYGELRVYKLYRVLRVAFERKLGLADDGELVVAEDIAQVEPSLGLDGVTESIRGAHDPQINRTMMERIAAATELRESGRPEEAEAVLRELLAESPGHDAPVVELFQHLTKIGELRRAHEVLLQREAEIEKPSVGLLEALAISYRNLEQWERSIATLIEIRREYLGAEDFEAHGHFASAMASTYEQAGRLDDAEACLLEIAEQLSPGDDGALEALIEFYRRHNRPEDATRYRELQLRIRHQYVNPMTRRNYLRLTEILESRGIAHVAAQYPTRRVESLHRLLDHDPRPRYVDNAFIEELVERDGYDTYFIDRFAIDFGHMTSLGYELLAENIARAIVEAYFGRPFDEDWRASATEAAGLSSNSSSRTV